MRKSSRSRLVSRVRKDSRSRRELTFIINSKPKIITKNFFKLRCIKLLNIKSIKKDIDEVINSYKKLLELIKKYAKEDIVVTGYFNPLPKMTQFKDQIDEVIKYLNNSIEEMCNELDVKYVDLFDALNNKKDIFTNPLDIHPSKLGYEIISKEIIKNIET